MELRSRKRVHPVVLPHHTIGVLEGLLKYERATGKSADLAESRSRGEHYLLERRMIRRLSTGELIEPSWSRFSFPTRYHYDVLRGLDYLRRADVTPEERCAEAIALVEQKRGEDGRWLLENPHSGEVHFDVDDGEGKPSRWITLRALRVLDWYDSGRAT